MITKTASINITTNATESKTKIDGLKNSTENLNTASAKNTKSFLDNNAAMSIADKITGGFASQVKSAAENTGLMSTAQKALSVATGTGTSAMKVFQIALASTGIGLIIVAVGLLINYMSDLDPVVDTIEQGMAAFGAVIRVVQQALASLFSSTEDSGKAFGELGTNMAKAAKDAAALKEAQQDLADQMDSQDVANAQASQRYDELILKSKNRTLTEKERIKILEEADGIEKANFLQRKALATADLAQAREAARIKGALNDEEIKSLKRYGIAYANYLRNKGKIGDDEVANIKKGQMAVINIEKENTARNEKSNNKKEALADKAAADEKNRNDKAVAASEKRAADAKTASDKRIANAKTEADKLIAIEKEKNDFFAKLNAGATEFEISNKKEAQQILDELNKSSETPGQKLQREFDEKASILQANGESIIALQSKFIIDKQALEDDAASKSIDADKKTAEEKSKIDIAQKEHKAAIADQLAAIASGLNNLLQVAGIKNKAILKAGLIAEKAAAIGSIIMNTMVANAKAVAISPATAGQPFVALNYVGMGIGIASTIASTVKALSELGGGGAGGGGSVPSGGGGSTSAPSRPNIAFQNSPQAQISDTIQSASASRNSEPIKAYVVGSDITNRQALDRQISDGAKF